MQENLKYSDIIDGKYDIDELRSLQQSRSISVPQQQQNYRDLITELLNAQNKCADNINQLGYLLESKQHTRMNSSQLNQSQVSMYTPTKNQTQFTQSMYNDNMLEQIDKLIKIKKVDQGILLRIIRKHMNECPQFVQLVKQEFRNSIL